MTVATTRPYATEVGDDRLAHKYELWDDLPEGFAAAAARIASGQSLAELVGVLPFAEWIDEAPDFDRKRMLVAKVQDEVGHGHVMARVAEDLGHSRDRTLDDFAAGNTKLLNIFHYGFKTWEEIGPAALLMNSSAIAQFQSLHQGTYLPYARALRKIEKEESFHYHHALDMTHQTLTLGSESQRRVAQQAFETWLPRVLAYYGPPDTDTYADNVMYKFGLKVNSNDQLRQAWLTKIIPVCSALGLEIDPDLVRFDEASGQWQYVELDWTEIKTMLREGGPRYRDWRQHIADSRTRNRAYRNAAAASAGRDEAVKAGTETDVYEVFGRMGDGPNQPITWLGSVRAADPKLAWHAAKEIYTRRENCTLLWVAPRAGMVMSQSGDAEVLRTPQRLSYRTPGFPGRHRRDRAAAQAAAEAGADA